MRLRDKVCVITGAGSGMGRVASEIFAREGAKVAAVELNPVSGAETVGSIQQEGGDAAFFAADVASEASVRDAVAAVVTHYGQIDVL